MTQREPAAGSTVADVGEDGLVAGILRSVGPAASGAAHVLVGPGDDAAVVAFDGPVVVSTDTLVEGRDFRRDWSTAHDVGVKTAAQNLADVAAMGARPVGLVVSLAVPRGESVDWVQGLAAGLARECARAGAVVLGGDVSDADEIVVTGTALGVLPAGAAAVLRSGARPGDVVAVSGTTGPSAAGLALLLAGGDGADLDLLASHRAPRPDYAAGPRALASGASALIDTSDGLLRDLARVAAASGVVLDLDATALAPDPALLAAAASLGAPDPFALALEWVLAGGEDHALAGCFPPGVPLPEGFHAVGAALPAGEQEAGVVLVGGRPWTGPVGWRHFGTATPP